ncbi:hypothetical protein ABIC89_001008 [Variovorax boronicumulans]|uniref:hypothetical protein n=1 Tax=Variovorax boronicumulans TaxID=436515 RepID=UPI003391BE3E
MKQQLILLAIAACVPALGLVAAHLFLTPGSLWAFCVVTVVELVLIGVAHALSAIFRAVGSEKEER